METAALAQSNYIIDYNLLHLSLPIDLGIKIDSNSEVVSFLNAKDKIKISENQHSYFVTN